MPVYEVSLFWVAVAFYAVASALLPFVFIFKKETLYRPALRIAFLGFVLHGTGILLRWVAVGRGPYLGQYEVISSNSWMALAFFFLVVRQSPRLRVAGVFMLPMSLLTLGIAVLQSPAIKELPATFETYWLVLHILFTKLAYGSFVTAAAIGVLYLVKENGLEFKRLSNLPSLRELDMLVYRFTALGFVLLTVMITAGSIWANQAWGRYWAWDPIETWALICWLLYGLFLHLRITYRWQGRKSAWFCVLALPVLIFTLFGLPFVYKSVHNYYLQ
jgi:cytochrome c-type biogenesis protein CcsB